MANNNISTPERNIVMSTNFTKHLKKVSKYPKFDADAMNALIKDICKGKQIPAKHKNHKLSHNSPKVYQGAYDFHLVPNIAIVYRFEGNNLILIDIGSHQDLGLTEKYKN